MSVHKKIDTFSNLNQKVVSLNVLQEFMDTISEEKSADDKIEKIGEACLNLYINYHKIRHKIFNNCCLWWCKVHNKSK